MTVLCTVLSTSHVGSLVSAFMWLLHSFTSVHIWVSLPSNGSKVTFHFLCYFIHYHKSRILSHRQITFTVKIITFCSVSPLKWSLWLFPQCEYHEKNLLHTMLYLTGNKSYTLICMSAPNYTRSKQRADHLAQEQEPYQISSYRARNSHPSDCPGQVDFRSDNWKRSHHLPFGQVDFECSYWWKLKWCQPKAMISFSSTVGLVSCKPTPFQPFLSHFHLLHPPQLCSLTEKAKLSRWGAWRPRAHSMVSLVITDLDRKYFVT